MFLKNSGLLHVLVQRLVSRRLLTFLTTCRCSNFVAHDPSRDPLFVLQVEEDGLL